MLKHNTNTCLLKLSDGETGAVFISFIVEFARTR